MVELASEKLRGPPAQVAVTYFSDQAAAKEVGNLVARQPNCDPTQALMNGTSAVVAAHASPGAFPR